ncbi:MAG: hypothetical protein E7530_01150 [Ruminococcaceae bacterium]|nr:hypothetical protein [Oscillospiraceae bacterium]
MSILNKLLEKLGKKQLFIIEAISSVFGFLSTYILSYLTSKYAKEKGRTKLSSFIKYIGVIDVFLTGLIYIIYPEGGKIFFIVSMYIASALCNTVLIIIQKRLFESAPIDINAPEKIAHKKKFLIAFWSVLISFVIFILAVVLVWVSINDKRHIEDTNGPDNYDLQTIDDSTLLYKNTSSFGRRPVYATSGEKSGAKASMHDYDNIKFTMECMTGTKVIQTSYGKTDTLILNFDTKVHSGNCEIVILLDSKIYQRVDVNTQQTIEIENAKDKEFSVVIGAESANVEIYIDREFK